jgi:hypothetical protein
MIILNKIKLARQLHTYLESYLFGKRESFMTLIRIVAATLVLAGLSQAALAAPITCIDTPGPRTWTLGEATACGTGPSNPSSSADINTVDVDVGAAADFAGTWVKEGDVTQEGDLSSLLNVSLTSGTWGNQPVAGTWTLVANFWSMYSGAVITIHVGGAQTDPDDFAAFRITSGQLSGTWSFSQGAGTNGGGLSNVGIWTSGPRQQVPEPMTLGLLGLGLAGVGIARRRRKA